MRAARFHGRHDVRVEDVSEATVGPDEVRVDVAACGICGTDLHEYEAGPIFVPAEPHGVTGESMPVTMGHEFSGLVTDVGDDVTELAEGDAVAVNPVLACGNCPQCARGDYHICDDVGFVGLSGRGGGFAENVVVKAEQAIPLGDVPLEHGALVEPLSVALHAVRRSGLRAGDTAAVFGSGPIGLSVIQTLRAAGAGEIFVSEPRPARRELAAECGADVLVDPSQEDAVDRIARETDGGADVTFEVAGIEATFNDALHATRPGGQMTVVSIFEGGIEVNPIDFVLGERSLTGTLAYLGGPRAAEEYGKVIRMLDAGKYDPEPLITARIVLDDLVDDGFESLLDPESEQVKVLVEP